MDSFISLPAKERALLLNEAAKRHGKMNARIIEKDLWVCWTLKMMFGITEISKHLTFKGGTSLSKAYGLIERFSEDVDLTIDKEYLGITDDERPKDISSRKVRQEFRKKLDKACIKAVAEGLLPLLQSKFSAALGNNDWSLAISEHDPLTILFSYPRSVRYNLGNLGIEEFGYIKPVIRLEFGARGDSFPVLSQTITSYVADILPELFNNPDESRVVVNTLEAERTFFEKVAILHDLYHRDKDKILKQAIARHYYDTVMLTRKGVATRAMEEPELLKAVTRNARLNCTDSNESENYKAYDELLQRNIKLVPQEQDISNLRKDYVSMQDSGMFFDDTPSFDEIIEELKALEEVLNKR